MHKVMLEMIIYGFNKVKRKKSYIALTVMSEARGGERREEKRWR